ncbi:hypothetical protein NDU88_006555 [Pleurodeles waltl]|uniref:Uncharacterized protein n=1 Tax=Pleurodeles waltl TaxID=8319 RepID=A0AAV7WGQ1_PLEWA|nr:hypothetical protein NDU88_006555 [Pleurodeles waltl]
MPSTLAPAPGLRHALRPQPRVIHSAPLICPFRPGGGALGTELVLSASHAPRLWGHALWAAGPPSYPSSSRAELVSHRSSSLGSATLTRPGPQRVTTRNIASVESLQLGRDFRMVQRPDCGDSTTRVETLPRLQRLRPDCRDSARLQRLRSHNFTTFRDKSQSQRMVDGIRVCTKFARRYCHTYHSRYSCYCHINSTGAMLK